MIILKKTHNTVIAEKDKEISALKKYIWERKPFVNTGIEAAQQALRGYKWVDLSYVSDQTARSATFNIAVKAAENKEGSMNEKLRAALDSIHKNTSYYFSEKLIFQKKNLLKALETVTSVSPYTGQEK